MQPVKQSTGPPRTDWTAVLTTLGAGQALAADALLPAMYGELRALAESYLRDERPGHTLQATALVHEAYLKMIDQRHVTWQNRAHFFALAAQAMRRILLDHARGKKREKRGGKDGRQILLSDATPIIPERELDLVALDEALTRLAQDAPVDARIVEMRFFAGLSEVEIAGVLDMTDRTVRRHWNYAKAWLFREISKGDTRNQPRPRGAISSAASEDL